MLFFITFIFSTCCMAQVDSTKREEDENAMFQRVEIESQYSLGLAAWENYVAKNLRYPKKARKQFAAGTVHHLTVQFVVGRDSTVSDLIAKDDPGYGLGDEAKRLVLVGGKWIPAVQNGRVVAAYKRVVFVFRRPG